MPSGFSAADVDRIAALARLALDEGERAEFAGQLARILSYAEEIRAIETSGVPPTTHTQAAAPMFRPDRSRPSLGTDEALRNAPDADRDAGLFKVPRVLG